MCVQPLELIKNVCCNLFYYGGHLWLHIHLGAANLQSQSQSQPPLGIIHKRVVITFADLFQMHFYLPNLNKSNFRFSFRRVRVSLCVGVCVCVSLANGMRFKQGLEAGGTLCIYLCRNVIKNLKTLMKTNFSPGLTKLTHIEETRNQEGGKKRRRTTEAESSQRKSKGKSMLATFAQKYPESCCSCS